MASTFVRVTEHLFAILNTYEGSVYVHVHNKFNKKKRFSLKYDDLKILFSKEPAFERALDRLTAATEEESAESDDDVDDDRAFKSVAHYRDEPAKKTSKHTLQRPESSWQPKSKDA